MAYDDPMAEMKKLRQNGIVQEYLMAFDSLMDKAELSEEQAASYFLVGLKHEIEMIVRIFNPRTLQTAYSLAKLQEALKNDLYASKGMVNKGLPNKYNGPKNTGVQDLVIKYRHTREILLMSSIEDL